MIRERTHRGRLVLYEQPDETWGWRLESENGRIIAVGDPVTLEAANREATQVLYGEHADVQIDRERRQG